MLLIVITAKCFGELTVPQGVRLTVRPFFSKINELAPVLLRDDEGLFPVRPELFHGAHVRIGFNALPEGRHVNFAALDQVSQVLDTVMRRGDGAIRESIAEGQQAAGAVVFHVDGVPGEAVDFFVLVRLKAGVPFVVVHHLQEFVGAVFAFVGEVVHLNIANVFFLLFVQVVLAALAAEVELFGFGAVLQFCLVDVDGVFDHPLARVQYVCEAKLRLVRGDDVQGAQQFFAPVGVFPVHVFAEVLELVVEGHLGDCVPQGLCPFGGFFVVGVGFYFCFDLRQFRCHVGVDVETLRVHRLHGVAAFLVDLAALLFQGLVVFEVVQGLLLLFGGEAVPVLFLGDAVLLVLIGGGLLRQAKRAGAAVLSGSEGVQGDSAVLLFTQRVVAVQPRSGLADADGLGQAVQAHLLVQIVQAHLLLLEGITSFLLIQVHVDVIAAFLPPGRVQARVVPHEFLAVLALVARATHRRIVHLLASSVHVHEVAVHAGLTLQFVLEGDVGVRSLDHPVLLIVEVGDFLIGHVVEEGAVKEHARVGEGFVRGCITERVAHVAGEVFGHALAAPLVGVDGEVLVPGGFAGNTGGAALHEFGGEVLAVDGDAVCLFEPLVGVAGAGVAFGVVLLLVGLVTGFGFGATCHGGGPFSRDALGGCGALGAWASVLLIPE